MSYHHHIICIQILVSQVVASSNSYPVSWYHTCHQDNIIISLTSLKCIIVPSILLKHIHRRFKSIFIIKIKQYLFGRFLDDSKQKTGNYKTIKIIKTNYQQATQKPYPLTDLGVSSSPRVDLSQVGPQSLCPNLYHYNTQGLITTL